MKKIFLALTFLSAISVTSFAQCDKNITLKASKTEYLNANGNVQRTIDESVLIEITKSTITIVPGNDHTMIGDIKSYTCTWKTPYKEGKSVIKAAFTEQDKTRTVTITIEDKDGKISLLVTFDDDAQKRIRVWADSFEEKK